MCEISHGRKQHLHFNQAAGFSFSLKWGGLGVKAKWMLMNLGFVDAVRFTSL